MALREYAEVKTADGYVGVEVVAEKSANGGYVVCQVNTATNQPDALLAIVHRDTNEPTSREWVVTPNRGQRSNHSTLGGAVSAVATDAAKKAAR